MSDIIFTCPFVSYNLNYKNTFYPTSKSFPNTEDHVVDIFIEGSSVYTKDRKFIDKIEYIRNKEIELITQGKNRIIYTTEQYNKKVQEKINEVGRKLNTFFVGSSPSSPLINNSGFMKKTVNLLEADLIVIDTKQSGLFSSYVKDNRDIIMDLGRREDLYSILNEYKNVDIKEDSPFYFHISSKIGVEKSKKSKENVNVLKKNLYLDNSFYLHYIDLMFFTLLTREELLEKDNKNTKDTKDSKENKLPLIIFDYVLDINNSYNLDTITDTELVEEIENLDMFFSQPNNLQKNVKVAALELAKFNPVVIGSDDYLEELLNTKGNGKDLVYLIKSAKYKDFTFFVDNLYYYSYLQHIISFQRKEGEGFSNALERKVKERLNQGLNGVLK